MLLDSTEASVQLGVTRRHVVRMARKLGVGRIIRKVLRLTAAEVAQLAKERARSNPSGAMGRPRARCREGGLS
jgi:hypothetical protein